MLEDSDGQKHSNGIHCSARVMVTRTIELDRNDLDKSIEVLSSAAQTLKLTRFERLSYRALMLTADVAAVGYLARFLIAACLILFGIEEYSILLLVFGALVELVAFVGIVALMLNIPAFVRIFRERARVKQLGLSFLSKSLWKESCRGRWISQARGCLLIGIGVVLVLSSVAAPVYLALVGLAMQRGIDCLSSRWKQRSPLVYYSPLDFCEISASGWS